MSNPIRCEVEGSVTKITLNRPEVGNRVTNEMGRQLAEMIAAAGESQLIVLRGAGGDFCVGRDLGPPPPGLPLTALDVRRGNTEPVLALYGAFRRSPVPVLGVVTGRAIGLGCALAGLCDVTIASSDARFQLPEMQHDIPPCLVMFALLDRVPRKALTHFVYSTDEIDAATALSIGLVSRVVPGPRLEAEVGGFISTMTTRSPAAVRAVKEFLRSAPAMDAQGAADFASNLLSNVLSSRR
jgi:enoyl-CoA hydratase/carnithine racemase